MKHPTLTPEERVQIVTMLANLRYDSLRDVLNDLAFEVRDQTMKDIERGRTKLAACLARTENLLSSASWAMDNAWAICEPYMKEVFYDSPTTRKKIL